MSSTLPVLYFDRPLPVEYDDLVAGRAVAVGPDPGDLVRAQGVIAGAHRWDAAEIAKGPNLRVISRTGVGYDGVDVAAATLAGVVVCYAPDAPTVSTAEHAMMLILAVTKGLPAMMQRAAAGQGASPTPTSLELDGATLGLVGFGRIARRVATAARALGMHTIACDPYLGDGGTNVEQTVLVALDELWRRADVVTLHAPATPETVGVLGAAALAAMRPGAYLVNCARGSLVDHDALLDSLDRGDLAGAALDVTEPEPLPADHPLLVHPQVIVTPHAASSTAVGRRRLYEHAIDNALAVLAGRPASVVPEQLDKKD